MAGFFSAEDYTATRVRGCASCGLSRNCTTPLMPVYGKGKGGVLIVGSMPGEEEDETGEAMCGRPGRLLTHTLEGMGLYIERDAHKTNAVICHSDEAPTLLQIEACRRFLFAEIESYKPRVIIVLGDAALRSLMGHRWKRKLGGISKWRGALIPDSDFKAWVCPTFHPASVLAMRKDPAMRKVWEDDLQRIVDLWRATPNREAVPCVSLAAARKRVKCLTDPKLICKALRGLIKAKPPLVGVDFETTGLKPDAEGHCIVTCAVATPKKAVAFTLGTDPSVKALLSAFLMSNEVRKAVWDLQYEQRWCKAILGHWIARIGWDGLLASHIMNCYPGTCSLKFQTYVRLGVVNYEAGIGQYFKTKDSDSSNALNSIHKAPVDTLLLYNGLDALFTVWLAQRQRQDKEFAI